MVIQRVQRWSLAIAASMVLSATPGPLVIPVAAAAVASSGDLLVGNGGSNSVSRFDGATGAWLGDFVAQGSGGLASPRGLAFGPDGNLYVSSRNNSSVLRYDGATGAFIDAFVPSGSGGLSTAVGLTFGPDGNLYVASRDNHAVLRYDGATGAFIGTFVASGSGGLRDPRDPEFGPDGDLYVSSAANNTVRQYDGSTGASVGVFATSADPAVQGCPSCLWQPIGIDWGPNGDLYVSSYSNNRVQRFDGTSGTFVATAAVGNQLNGAIDAEFGPDGKLYVSSNGTSRVIRFDPATGAFDSRFVANMRRNTQSGTNGGETGAPTWLVFVP
jgi:DNA-binding beta-propeller fold protein YncE